MRRVRTDLSSRPGARSVVHAHAFVTGAQPSESERDISVGGVASVPLATFDGVDYAALGHLHGPQRLSDTVRYSGSPLAYSFSEDHHRKAVLLVDLDDRPGRPPTVESLPTPVPRPLARLTGTLDDLLTGARWAGHTGHYLQITLTDPVRPREPMQRLRARFPHVLVLGFAPVGARSEAERSYAERVRGRTDQQIATDFVEHVRGEVEPAESTLLGEALEQVRRAEATV
jgi:exonuclease SbcD